jgi:hypothetical protein
MPDKDHEAEPVVEVVELDDRLDMAVDPLLLDLASLASSNCNSQCNGCLYCCCS